jgi:hypothetical protein
LSAPPPFPYLLLSLPDPAHIPLSLPRRRSPSPSLSPPLPSARPDTAAPAARRGWPGRGSGAGARPLRGRGFGASARPLRGRGFGMAPARRPGAASSAPPAVRPRGPAQCAARVVRDRRGQRVARSRRGAWPARSRRARSSGHGAAACPAWWLATSERNARAGDGLGAGGSRGELHGRRLECGLRVETANWQHRAP